MPVPERVVVGAAIVRAGQVLAARRTAPPVVAGRWELPGGKVEAGESREQAVGREVREELGCRVEVTGWLRGRVSVRPGLVLEVALATLLEGEPTPTEHDRLAWLGPEDLTDVDWSAPDLPFLDELRERLLGDRLPAQRTPGRHGRDGWRVGGRVGSGAGEDGRVRGIFFDHDDARAVVAALQRDGWSAELSRERLAGEDDDEDHPWAVGTDAPEPALDLLVETYDGWLDSGQPPTPGPPGLVLPRAPRRRRGEGGPGRD